VRLQNSLLCFCQRYDNPLIQDGDFAHGELAPKRVLGVIPSPQIHFDQLDHFAASDSEGQKIVPLTLNKYLTAKLITAVSNSRTSHPVTWILAMFLLTCTIFAVDLATGPQISLSIFYLIPVSLATWRFRLKLGIVFSFVCSAAWGAADILAGNMYSFVSIPIWNAGVRLGFFLIVAYMLDTLSMALESARTDVLTGILNVRGFREQAERELARCAREGHGFSLVYLDLDNFRTINNRLGHRFGDAVLRRVGTVLGRRLRRTDIAARIGGDEFVVLFPATDYLAAESAVGKLHAALKQAFARRQRLITFSIGVATFDFVPESLDSALNEADTLMYVSKRNGKGKVTHRKMALLKRNPLKKTGF
jgi:diguanylate cyclase (GGDEF)-like protein